MGLGESADETSPRGDWSVWLDQQSLLGLCPQHPPPFLLSITVDGEVLEPLPTLISMQLSTVCAYS